MDDNKIIEQLKPVVCALIAYYYQLPDNELGGLLHVVLDDGNVSSEDIWHGQKRCAAHDDELGYLIGLLLRHYTEDEREHMYNNGWAQSNTVLWMCALCGWEGPEPKSLHPSGGTGCPVCIRTEGMTGK